MTTKQENFETLFEKSKGNWQVKVNLHKSSIEKPDI